MRTSTVVGCVLPTGRISFDSIARSSFDWRPIGMSPISSRKIVPPRARLKSPSWDVTRAGERAAHVAEELALEQVLGNRSAVDGQEDARCDTGCC